MTLREKYVEWQEAIGIEGREEGIEESIRWIEELGWTPEEMSELLDEIARQGVLTALEDGRLLEMGPAIAIYAFRFGIDIEAKKHLPAL